MMFRCEALSSEVLVLGSSMKVPFGIPLKSLCVLSAGCLPLLNGRSLGLRACSLLVFLVATVLTGTAAGADMLLSADWKRNDLATPRYEIRGTGGRSNPLRTALNEAFNGDALYVRFRLNYAAETIDTPTDGSGEFFVLWLDAAEGNDGSTHSNGVPNIGIHTDGNVNRFMVRYDSKAEVFGPELQGDRDVLIVGRLKKSTPGPDQPFDLLDVWIDPTGLPVAEQPPNASARTASAISQVRWIGFSTGVKTEFEDRIVVWDIGLETSWSAILELPGAGIPEAATEPMVQIPRTIDFRTHVYPILKSHCFDCHSGADAEHGVRLDVLDEVLNQTAPRDAHASQLIQLVSNGKMPPDGPQLDADQQRILRTWIDEGLDWDEDLLPTPVPQISHWAFQPIQRPQIPDVPNPGWVQTPVDAFIAARHAKVGLTPAPLADADTLRRRLSLDLLGLPPGFAEDADAAENSSEESGDSKVAEGAGSQIFRSEATDNSALPKGAVADHIERLLVRPAYGERWGRHWLDVVRWAESNGHQHNLKRPHAWRYRDWVVNAFNADMPYNEFLKAQIAGDELHPHRDENLIATGFLAAARYSGNELDKSIQRNDILVDITNTTATAVLGLTLECAQCHTHKFDPISIRDYYRFQAFFAKGQPGNVVLGADQPTAAAVVKGYWQIYDQVRARLVASKRRQGIPEPILVTPKAVIGGIRGKQKLQFQQLTEQLAKLPQTWGYYSPLADEQPLAVAPHQMRWPLPYDLNILKHMKTSLLIRGDVKSRGPDVEPGWPAVFGATPDDLKRPRTALAEWMADAKNPLTARVWTNRVWQWHFGRGLVETSGDFGTQSSPPTHPELLDFLASELIDSGWSTHHLHRLILNSATWQQSSGYHEDNGKVDPDNHLLWRWTPRRLEAEAIRDCILAVSGQLDLTRGGPGVDVRSPRRALYLKQQRDRFPHQQVLFDSASGIVSCTQRPVSTTALQPLWLMNSELVQQAAEQFANHSEDIRTAIRNAYGRSAEPDEVASLQMLVDRFGLPSACLAILNSSEFLYLP